MTRAALALVLAAGLAAPALPRADDVALARARFKAGADLYKARRYREAIDAFEAAYRLKPHGAIHFNVAQCREKLEEWPGALRSYQDYLREVPDARDRAAVRAAIGRLEARLAAAGVQALLVYSDPPGAALAIDGRSRGKTPVHIALPPGTYRIALALEGYEPDEQDVELTAAGSRVVDVVLRSKGRGAAPAAAPAVASTIAPTASTSPDASAATPAPGAPSPAVSSRPDLAARPPAPPGPLAGSPLGPAAPPGRAKPRVYTWIAAGTAVAAAGAATWFGLAASAQRDRLVDGTARADADRIARDAKSKARTANVLWATSGVAAAAGATLFFVEGRF